MKTESLLENNEYNNISNEVNEEMVEEINKEIKQKQDEALRTLINGCLLAQKRGAYTLEEAAGLNTAVKLFTQE